MTTVSDDALALVRVLEHVTPDEWAVFASRYRLEQWLCIALKKELADSVAAFVAAQQNIAFQRDHDPLTGVQVPLMGNFTQTMALLLFLAVQVIVAVPFLSAFKLIYYGISQICKKEDSSDRNPQASQQVLS